MKKIGLVMAMAIFVVLSSCKKEEEYVYVDGDYSAEAADYHYGWKAFMEVEISNDAQISVTFDYTDEDGNLKTATTDEEYAMNPHPRVWVPELETQLMAADIVNFADVDGVSGATSGSSEANELFALILEAAKTGDLTTQVLPAE